MFTLDSEIQNQQYLADQASKLLPLAKRHKFPLSLIKIDIDHFEKIKDHYGPETWNTVIECLNVLIQSTSRQEDIIVRYHNQGFAILLAYCDLENALAKAERLGEAIVALNPDNVGVSASIGVTSMSVDDKCEWDALLHAANSGLNKAKDKGGNCVEVIKSKG